MTTKHIFLVTLYIPTALRENANKVLDALGHGKTNLDIENSLDGTGEATHYSMVMSATLRTKNRLQAAKSGTLPPRIRWADFGLTKQQALDVFAAFKMDIKRKEDVAGRNRRKAHLDIGAMDNGLVRKKRTKAL